MGPTTRTACLLSLLCAIGAAEVQHPLLALPPDQRAAALHRALHEVPRVTWSAAEASLLATLPAIQQPPCRVLVQLGTDELTPRRRAAFDGDWWAAVFALCTRYGLELVPTSDDGAASGPLTSIQRLPGGRSSGLPLDGGAVILRPAGRDPGPQLVACGPLAMIVERVERVRYASLTGDRSWADIDFHLRLHPGAPLALISEAQLNWHRAVDDDGRELDLRLDRQAASALGTLLTAVDDDAEASAAGAHLRLGGLGPESRAVILSGELALTAQAHPQHHASLGIGGVVEIQLDRTRYRAELLGPQPDGDDARLVVTALDGSEAEDLRIALFTPDGAPLRPTDRQLAGTRRPNASILHFQRLPVERYTLRLGREVDLGHASIPLECRVVLP